MHKSITRLISILSGILSAAGMMAAHGQTSVGTKPNVLFIAMDDFNHWAGHLGRNVQAKTPNIDRLAQQGVAFRQAYCAVPACEPSRAALMSGLRPWTTACYQNGDNWKKLIPEGSGLTAQFLKAGYYVAGAGKIYHGDQFFPSEWTDYMKKEGLSSHGEGVAKNEGFLIPVAHDLKDDDLDDWHTVNWCIEKMQEKRDKPAFIACGLHKPHLPFAVPRKYYDMFPLESIQLPPFREDDLDDIPRAGVRMARPDGDHAKIVASGRWKDAIRSYLATCAYADMNIGRLLAGLEKSPIARNTIIVLWGDHGWSFGEKKHWRKFALWEEPTRNPLIWVVPGVTRPGGMVKSPVDLMTVYPTLCELAGIAIPAHVQGKSVAKLLQDPGGAWQEPAITTHGYMNHSVRTADWRYIRYADGSEELYDERADPYEWTNLANKPETAEIRKKLMTALPKENKPALKTSRAQVD